MCKFYQFLWFWAIPFSVIFPRHKWPSYNRSRPRHGPQQGPGAGAAWRLWARSAQGSGCHQRRIFSNHGGGYLPYHIQTSASCKNLSGRIAMRSLRLFTFGCKMLQVIAACVMHLLGSKFTVRWCFLGSFWLQAELHRVVEVWVADAMAAARNQGWSHQKKHPWLQSLQISPDKKH